MKILLPYPEEGFIGACCSGPGPGWQMIPFRALDRSFGVIELVMAVFFKDSKAAQDKRSQKPPNKALTVFVICVFCIFFLFAYVFSISVECFYQITLPIWSKPMRFIVYVLTLAILIVPGYYIWHHPNESLSPMAQNLKDLMLFLLTGISSYFITTDVARRQANNKWVPQAKIIMQRPAHTMGRSSKAAIPTCQPLHYCHH